MIPTVREAMGTADIVFVGTVSATAQNNAWATVSIEEVWKGPDLPAVFEVRGGPGGNTVTSVDRAFEVGTRYLFVPFGMEDTFASDNSCSATQPWDESLAALRPADARGPIGGPPPAPAPFDLLGAVLPFGVALLVAGVLVAVGLVARSRRSD